MVFLQCASRSDPPLEGGSKNSSAATNFSGRGHATDRGFTPPRNLLRFASQISTLPQGEGRTSAQALRRASRNGKGADLRLPVACSAHGIELVGVPELAVSHRI